MRDNIIEIDFTSQIQASCECGICDEEECECPCHQPNAKQDEAVAEQDEAVAFSVKIIETLMKKLEEHNGNEQNSKVGLDELKDAFRRGASAHSEDKTLSELGMARVNFLLRIKAGQFKNLTSDEIKGVSELSGLVFENNQDSIFDKEIDISEDWNPQEEDFAKASEDIEKHNLNYNFKNINDLYLDTQGISYTELD